MKKAVLMLLALILLAAPALGERYDSGIGYSMDLPEGWLPLNRDTYQEIAAHLSAEQLSQMGLTGDIAQSMIDAMAGIGMEYLFSGDGLANASVAVVQQEPTPERLVQSAEVARQIYEQNGATDAVAGPAKFGENEFQAAACTLKGVVVANYFCAAGDRIYAITFTNASAADVSRMLASAAFSAGAGESADAEETPPAGAVFAMDGALKEPRG